MKQELTKDWTTRDVSSIAPDTRLSEAHRTNGGDSEVRTGYGNTCQLAHDEDRSI
jgi:hypothetical protein